MVTAVLTTTEQVTGYRPVSCPWSAFRHPLVSDVLEVYSLFESGQLALKIGQDPPRRLIDAVTHFHSAIRFVRDHDREMDRKQREAQQKAKSAAAGVKRGR